MEEHVRQLLLQLEKSGAENDAHQEDRRRKMLNLEPDTAQLLSILVKSGHRTRLLEIGTSNGYSTIWLAAAIEQTGGHLTSIECDAVKHSMAVSNLQKSGLGEWVTLCLGDATQVLGQIEGDFDFVFLDADRSQYPLLLSLLLPRLTPNALLLADNVHSHPEEIAPYLQALSVQSEFEHVVVGVGKGLSVALKREIGNSCLRA